MCSRASRRRMPACASRGAPGCDAAYSAACPRVVEARAVVVADARAAFAAETRPSRSGRACDSGSASVIRNVKSALAPARDRPCRQTDATGPGSSDSGPSAPSAEKSSQKCTALVHHRARGHPRSIVTWPLPAPSTQRPMLPANGLSGDSCGLCIRTPSSAPRVSQLVDAWIGPVAGHRTGQQRVLDRPGNRDASPAPPASSSRGSAGTATGRPESSASCGMNGLNASSDTCTGRRRSRKATCASGNSPVNVAACSRCRPGALRDPRPNGP